MPPIACAQNPSTTRSSRRSQRTVVMSMDNTDKTVKETRIFAYRKDGRRYTAGHCIETEIHAMNGSYPCPVGSRRVPAMVHSESEVIITKTPHEPIPGLPQGYSSVQSTIQRAWYRGDLNTWEARWDYTLDIAYRMPHVWDKCFDGYWAFKEDWKHHAEDWRNLKGDWKHARETLKQRLRTTGSNNRTFRRMTA